MTPAPMSDEHITAIYQKYGTGRTDGFAAAAAAIIAARDAMWSEMLGEPVGALYTIAGVQHCTITELLPDTDLYVMHKNVSEIDTSEKRV